MLNTRFDASNLGAVFVIPSAARRLAHEALYRSRSDKHAVQAADEQGCVLFITMQKMREKPTADTGRMGTSHISSTPWRLLQGLGDEEGWMQPSNLQFREVVFGAAGTTIPFPGSFYSNLLLQCACI